MIPARSETQHLHSFYKMLQHSPTFRKWKGMRTNADDFQHVEDFTVAETLETFQHRNKYGKYIDIT